MHRFAATSSALLLFAASAASGAGRLTTHVDFFHNFHSVNVSFGTPAQEFCLALQTSTGAQMLAGVDCKSKDCTKMPTRFNPKASSTYQATGIPWAQQCTGGSTCLGVLGRDNAVISGASGPIPIRNTTFGYADFVPKKFPAACSGLWGLGMVGNAPFGTPQTPLSLMKKEGLIEKELFSLYIDGETGEGSIDWGWIDDSKHVGPLFAAPMDTDYLGRYSYYLLTWESLYFRGKKLAGDFCVTEPCKAVLDNLPQAFIGPKKVVDELERNLNISADCSNYHSLPNMQLILPGPHELNIPPSVYINKRGNRCRPAFEGDNIHEDWVFGMPFFRAFYTVFNIEDKTFHIGDSTGKPGRS